MSNTMLSTWVTLSHKESLSKLLFDIVCWISNTNPPKWTIVNNFQVYRQRCTNRADSFPLPILLPKLYSSSWKNIPNEQKYFQNKNSKYTIFFQKMKVKLENTKDKEYSHDENIL